MNFANILQDLNDLVLHHINHRVPLIIGTAMAMVDSIDIHVGLLLNMIWTVWLINIHMELQQELVVML